MHDLWKLVCQCHQDVWSHSAAELRWQYVKYSFDLCLLSASQRYVWSLLITHHVISLVLSVTGWPQTWKTWNTCGFLWTWKTQRILCNRWEHFFNKQNSFSSIKYLFNTTKSWASNERSLMNFGDGCIASVCWWPVIFLELMWNDPWQMNVYLLSWEAMEKYSLWLWKKSGKLGGIFSPTLLSPCIWFHYEIHCDE